MGAAFELRMLSPQALDRAAKHLPPTEASMIRHVAGVLRQELSRLVTHKLDDALVRDVTTNFFSAAWRHRDLALDLIDMHPQIEPDDQDRIRRMIIDVGTYLEGEGGDPAAADAFGWACRRIGAVMQMVGAKISEGLPASTAFDIPTEQIREFLSNDSVAPLHSLVLLLGTIEAYCDPETRKVIPELAWRFFEEVCRSDEFLGREIEEWTPAEPDPERVLRAAQWFRESLGEDSVATLESDKLHDLR